MAFRLMHRIDRLVQRDIAPVIAGETIVEDTAVKIAVDNPMHIGTEEAVLGTEALVLTINSVTFRRIDSHPSAYSQNCRLS